MKRRCYSEGIERDEEVEVKLETGFGEVVDASFFSQDERLKDWWWLMKA